MPILLATGLLTSLAGFVAQYKLINFYLFPLLAPCIIILALLVAGDRIGAWLCQMPGLFAGISVVLLALISIALVFLHITPALLETTRGEGLSIKDQFLSYPAWKSERAAVITQKVADKCGIVSGNAPDLVVDDVTFGNFRSDTRPVFALYIHPDVVANELRGKLMEFLTQRKSTGWISRCKNLPEELQEYAVRQDDVCCVNFGVIRP